jgi:DNA modification methylase
VTDYPSYGVYTKQSDSDVMTNSYIGDALPARETGTGRSSGKAKSHRETEQPKIIDDFLNQIHQGDSAEVMARMPDDSVDLIITSPPYWTAVKYDVGDADEGDAACQWPTYEAYLDDMFRVWKQCARVLRPNGKLCINAPLMPIPKEIIPQHTRHLKDIAGDIGQGILSGTDLERYGLFIWQKQTSKMMFGSYPFPGNIIENNTIEMINVYVKPGKPPKFDPDIKEASRLSREEWLDLTQQVWFMYPEDVKRDRDHPAPFPEKLPARLIRLYTFNAFNDFPGEIVLDPFAGTGTTCAVAKRMGRRWIGIDLVPRYVEFARNRTRSVQSFQPLLLVGRPKYPTSDELREMIANTSGPQAEAKHKRKTYGRGVSTDDDGQLKLV